MTPKRPIEVVNASKACADAWIMRDQFIECKPELVSEMNRVCEWLGERYTDQYNEWQRMGGTSNIGSIVLDKVSPIPNRLADPRTPEQIDADTAAQEFNFDKIQEIPF